MAVLQYSILRLGVFAVVFVVCINLNLGRFTFLYALLIGLVISWAVSYLFFDKWRVAAGDQLAGRFGKSRRRSRAEADDNAAEDELAEQYHAESDPQATEPDAAEPDAAESADSDPQAAESESGDPGDSPPPQGR